MGRYGKRFLALGCPIMPLLDKGSPMFLEEMQASCGSQRSYPEEVPTSDDHEFLTRASVRTWIEVPDESAGSRAKRKSPGV